MINKKSKTYENDYKVEDCPKTGEVFTVTKCEPFKEHLGAEERAKEQIGPVQDVLQAGIVVQVDVLEAQRDRGGEDQDEDYPLEGRRVHDREHRCPHCNPLVAEIRR